MRALALLAFVVAAPALANPWDLEPPPRGQWVLDQTGRVQASTRDALNRLAADLDASGAGQLGVLVVQTTSGVKPRDFATGVFNSWGVGHAGANDGVLLFIAVGDRKAEIILGDGSGITTAQTDEVMRDDVVANLKRGDLDRGLLEAAGSLVQLSRLAAGKPATPHPDDNAGLGPDAYVTPTQDQPHVDERYERYSMYGATFPERSPRTWVVDLAEALTPSQRAQLDVAASDIYAAGTGRIFFLVVNRDADYPALESLAERLAAQVTPLGKGPVGVVALDLGAHGRGAIVLPSERLSSGWEQEQADLARYALTRDAAVDRVAAMLAAQRFAQQALEGRIPPRPMRDVLEAGLARHSEEVVGGGVLAAIIGLIGGLRWNRRRTRMCKACQQPRILLGDAAEDAHLSGAQKTEENVGSVDYDVWWCERCHDPLVLRYGKIFTTYSGCPSCSAKTLSSSTTTLSRATEYSGGSERVDQKCAHCSYRNSFTRSTPRITRSSSSSSSSRSSFSSSSSRSSFGGGSSSGRGSSGSW